MTVAAAGYLLKVPPERRDILLSVDEYGYFRPKPPFVAEPVPRFDHSRRAPLVVFCSFEDGKITHIADGRKGSSAGTDLVRLNLENLQPLSRPIAFGALRAKLPVRYQRHFDRTVAAGGLLTPKTMGAVAEAISDFDEALRARLARFSERRRNAIGRLSSKAKENLAFQKDAMGVALEIAGMGRDDLLAWTPVEGAGSFLDGLPSAKVREDVMLLADFSDVPGFEVVTEASHVGAKVFERHGSDPARLTVIMANRLPLEEQTGADLIYFNETFRCFVMVQYKAMERRDEDDEFRWKPGDQFCKEIARMDDLLTELAKVTSGVDPDGYRFTDNPFFLKFCSRVVFNPDDKGLFKGIYLPLDLWKRADSAARFDGPKGGKVLTFKNTGRRMNNTEFVGLVAGSWVGTSIEQSAVLEKVIRVILSSGKAVTFAIEQVGTARDYDAAEFGDDDTATADWL